MSWSRLIRFHPTSSPSSILIGQPTSPDLDIGTALLSSSPITATVFSGPSVLSPGSPTNRVETVHSLLSPLSPSELGGGCIRCIGLNYRAHAAEAGLELPSVPPLFIKPATALGNPYPTECCPLPGITRESDTGDFEAELAVVLGRGVKNVSEEEVREDLGGIVAGYTAANDVSCRKAQFEQSQWCYSKGFDGACPLGPCLVSPSALPDPTKLTVRGLKNDKEMQPATPISDLVFSIPKLISFLSQSTTLPAGTVIVTGTPAGVGFSRKPPETLKEGDVFAVEILPLVGTLYSKFEWEK